jgi:hypothetical protein
MAKTPRKSGDLNVTAFRTLQALTGAETGNPQPQPQPMPLLDSAEMRRQIMREMGRRGGQKGGKARADALSKKRRKEIASAAATARWARNLPEEN